MRSRSLSLVVAVSSMAMMLAAPWDSGSAAGGTSGSGTGGRGGATVLAPFEDITIPTALVPADATIKFKLHAKGVQIYTCAATPAADGGATTYAWTLKAPMADLTDETDTKVATHHAGPTWTSTVDGSDVAGLKLTGVDSPLSGAIQWLELKAVSHTGAGIFSDVTYVLRVNTKKGKAPATGCDVDHVAAETIVDYTADYYFYKSGSADAGVRHPAKRTTTIAG